MHERLINEHLANEKMQAQKNYEQMSTAAQPSIGRAVDQCEKQVPAVERLHRLRRDADRVSHERDRVIDILTRHPEFEEFLEVLRSGLI